MFSTRRSTDASIADALARAKSLPFNYPSPLFTQFGSKQVHVPPRYALDHTHSQIGKGQEAFNAGKEAMRQWQHFNLGWVRVANPDAQIQIDQIVAVEAHSPGFSRLGLWSVNLSRILYVIDEERRFGYGYGTTSMHVERGEERFLIEYDPATGKVIYDLLAVSHPAHWMALLAYPYTRSQQHRFARDSHARMAQL